MRNFFRICIDSFALLRKSDPLIMSSSTAFFATFSISPILLLLTNLFGLYFSSERMNNLIFQKLGATVGHEAASDIHEIVMNFMNFEASWWINTAAIIFFIFVSTTLLGVMKIHIHKLWRIKKTYNKVTQRFKERSIQISIILITAVLLLISVTIDSALAISLDYIQNVIPKLAVSIVRVLNVIFSLMIVATWFSLIFKFLPDAKVKWDVAFNGGFLTAVLYNLGKFALNKVLIHARIASIFGASASFALLLLFIFYCSFIIYYGAAFTHAYGEFTDKHIEAGKHSREFEEKFID